MRTEDFDGDLKLSISYVGKLYPVLVDKHGNVVDGNHRLAADKDWPKLRLEHINSRKELALARLISNVCRRSVSDIEKAQMLSELGEIHMKEGVSPGQIAHLIAAETGMSYRWVMKYLPDELKERPGVGGPHPSVDIRGRKEESGNSRVVHRATEMNAFLLAALPKILEVKDYANTDFVNFVMGRDYYSKIERIANKMGVTPEGIINATFISILKKMSNETATVQENIVILKEMC